MVHAVKFRIREFGNFLDEMLRIGCSYDPACGLCVWSEWMALGEYGTGIRSGLSMILKAGRQNQILHLAI